MFLVARDHYIKASQEALRSDLNEIGGVRTTAAIAAIGLRSRSADRRRGEGVLRKRYAGDADCQCETEGLHKTLSMLSV